MIFKLFEYLKINKIYFALTNGYIDVITQSDSDADVDMLFKKKDFKNIEIILQSFCKIYKLQLVQVLHHDLYAKNIFLFNPEKIEFLNLDIYADLSRKGLSFYSENKVFSTLVIYENIPIISTEKEFISYLYKKLDKNDLTLENFNYLNQLFLKDPKCIVGLKNFFPKTFSYLIDSFKTHEIEILLKNRILLLNDINRLKSKSFGLFIKNKIRIVKRIFCPTGTTISFLGPDGSGKSTIIENILKNRLPFRRNDYFHTKPIIVKKDEQTVQSEPHKYPAYSKLKSYLKISYFIFQYNKGWFKNIIPLKIKSSLIIFDRYFDDILADQKRYRYGAEIWFLKFARIFIPKPELYFVLTTKAEIIHERKNEVEFSELEKQIKEYESLTKNNKYFKIDVSKTPKEIADEIIKIMMKNMSLRYEKFRK